VTRSSYLLERAWVGGAVHDDVLVTIEDGRFTAVETGRGPGVVRDSRRLSGVATPDNRGFPRSAGETSSPHAPFGSRVRLIELMQ
jgi:hypothetical protein